MFGADFFQFHKGFAFAAPYVTSLAVVAGKHQILFGTYRGLSVVIADDNVLSTRKIHYIGDYFKFTHFFRKA